jgi:carbamoyl-phosphate synthase small subunit
MTRCLNARGCDVTLLPYNTKAEEILAGGYDGIMLSNGPGDPADNVEVIAEIKKLYDSDTPIFAVCLGHQLMALATGATTCRLAYGHRGANHPVRDIAAGRVFITSQNHGYMVKSETVDPNVATVSHVNVNDGTCEGLSYKNKRIFTVQFHPEANPGPKDTEYLFDKFLEMIDDKRAEEGEQNA